MSRKKTFSFTKNIKLVGTFISDKYGEFSGTLKYEVNGEMYIHVVSDTHEKLSSAIPVIHINGEKSATVFEPEEEKKTLVTGRVIDEEGNIYYIVILDCYIPNILPGGNACSFKAHFMNMLIGINPIPEEFLESADINVHMFYNVWDSFSYYPNFIRSKEFIGVEDKFSVNEMEISFEQDISGDWLDKNHLFDQIFFSKLDSELKPIISSEEKEILNDELAKILDGYEGNIGIKNPITHKSYIHIDHIDSINSIIDYSVKICNLLYILTNQKQCSLDTINVIYNKQQFSLVSRINIFEERNHDHRFEAFRKQDFSQSEWEKIFYNLFDKYDLLQLFFFTLNQNNIDTQRTFTPFTFTRTTDCISHIWEILDQEKAYKYRKYEYVIRRYLDIVKDEDLKKKVINKIFKIVRSIKQNNSELPCSIKEIGSCISKMRSSIVHNTENINRFNTESALNLYPYFELIIIDYIFNEIGLSNSKREKYATCYLKKLV